MKNTEQIKDRLLELKAEFSSTLREAATGRNVAFKLAEMESQRKTLQWVLED